jgi:hypothetical protein
MKKTALLFALFTLITIVSAHAQYKLGIGARLNYGYGLSVKYKMTSAKAFEGILYTRWHGVNITGLYEIHKPAFQTPNWNWYYGIGGHIGFWGDGKRYGNPWFENNNSTTILGADGILGLEYTFKEIPLNLSLDWKPALNLIGYRGLWLDDVAVTARFAIK